ncbi:FkbM family methyltransferase [Candidatus Babeliales bacterium]|nr:FkbM family methyltransferase [Candidatus Babeliales bacterium]
MGFYLIFLIKRIIKKTIFFLKKQNNIFKKKVYYFLRLLKYFFKDLKNEYKFTISDRYLGAKLCVGGYNQQIKENYYDFNEILNKVVVNDLNIYVPKNSFKKGELSYLYKEVFLPIKKNPHAYEMSFVRINPGDVVIDAGSCEGFFTFYALNKYAKKIYAFEPLGLFEESLKKTFFVQIKNGKVSIIKKGLSDKTGTEKFYSDGEYICTAKFDKDGKKLVETITIDNFVIHNNCSKIDFIKMDIENAEVKAIKGAKDTIKKFLPRMSIAVYHDHKNAKEIKRILLEYVPEYKVIFGGCYMYELPYRPYMIYAYV